MTTTDFIWLLIPFRFQLNIIIETFKNESLKQLKRIDSQQTTNNNIWLMGARYNCTFCTTNSGNNNMICLNVCLVCNCAALYDCLFACACMLVFCIEVRVVIAQFNTTSVRTPGMNFHGIKHINLILNWNFCCQFSLNNFQFKFFKSFQL